MILFASEPCISRDDDVYDELGTSALHPSSELAVEVSLLEHVYPLTMCSALRLLIGGNLTFSTKSAPLPFKGQYIGGRTLTHEFILHSYSHPMRTGPIARSYLANGKMPS